MAWYRSRITGNGANDNPFRSPLKGIMGSYRVLVDARPDPTKVNGTDWMVCWAEPDAGQAAQISADPRLDVFSKTLFAELGIPDDVGNDKDAVAQWAGKRALINQILGVDLPKDLTTRFDELPVGQQNQIRNRAASARKPLDTSEIRGSSGIGVAASHLMRQVKVKTFSDAPNLGGTYSFDFVANAPATTTNIEDIDGANWTRIDGATGDLYVTTAGNLTNLAGASAGLVLCPDQGSDTLDIGGYVKGALVNGGSTCNAGLAQRATDAANMLTVSTRLGNTTEFNKIVLGVSTELLQSDYDFQTDDIVELQSDADDAHSIYYNGSSSVGPTTDTAHNTVTRQGVRWAGNPSFNRPAINTFEAGVITPAAAGGATGRILGMGVGRMMGF